MPDRDEERLCLVGLCAAPGVGPASVARLRRAAREQRVPLREVVALPAEALECELGLAPLAARSVAALRNPCEAGRSTLDRLAWAGLRIATDEEALYPDRLGRYLRDQAPPVLFVGGDLAVLEGPCVAIVGSRQPSGPAGRAAGVLAADLAAEGSAVVSGGAPGIDSRAHEGAASAGATCAVPAVGVCRFRWRGASSAELAERGWCVLGQFPPDAGWRTAHALMRNRTIVALSDAVVAFDPRDTGGTWHTSLWALRMRKPLFVVGTSREGAKGRGLTHLVRFGAVALDPNRMPDAADFGRLVADYRPAASVDQLPLFDTQGL